MSNNQILFEQLKKALEQDDMITINILLQDEDLSQIKKMSQKIQQGELKQKYIKTLQEWMEKNIKSQQNKYDNNKIRQIQMKNKDGSDAQSQENIIEKQVQKRVKIKLQQKFGYQFYGIIKCLMIAYGDLNVNQQSIKIMHSQIQILFQMVFQFIYSTQLSILQNKQKQQQARLARIQSKVRNRNRNKQKQKELQLVITQITIKKYLSQIFKQQTTLYKKIRKQSKRVAKSAKNRQYSESDSQLKSQSQSQSDNEQCINPTKHMSNSTVEQIQYFAKLTKYMNIIQYQNYSQCRAVNFIQGNHISASNSNISKKNIQYITKLIKYIDGNMHVLKPTMRLFDLLSFLCCRIMRKIIFIIIRDRNEGRLLPLNFHNDTRNHQPYIKLQQIRRIGNDMIEQYQKKFIEVKQANQTIKQTAKKYFIQDLTYHNFMHLIPKAYLQHSNSTNPRNAQQIWQQCPQYQEMWVNRILGQKQIQKYSICKIGNKTNQQIQAQQQMYEPKNQYAKYIYKNMQHYRTKGNTWLWRKYFTQDNADQKQQQSYNNNKTINQAQKNTEVQIQNLSKPKKRVKLQSLNS